MLRVKDILFALRNSEHIRIYRDFLSDHYQQHNLARLQHLASLGLELDRKHVLEVGAGIGDHSLFYLYRGCEVLPTDGRPENVEFIRKRLGIRAEVLDPEQHPGQLSTLGKFDILHCYGFLYHISNPEIFLEHAAKTAHTILLETCVSWGKDAQKNVVSEQADVLCQALHGKGCRPTRPWVFQTLQQHFKHVYCPRTQPKHAEFPLNWEQPFANPALLSRAVFVASHAPVASVKLTSELPLHYDDSSK